VRANLLVLVQGVDDELHHAVDFSLELVLLRGLAKALRFLDTQSVKLDSLR
jgi:hypothetical protein